MSAEVEPPAVIATEPAAAAATIAEGTSTKSIPAKSKKKVTLPPEIQAPPGTPLAKLLAELPSIIKEADYNEMWGVTLSEDSHVPTTIVLEKFLRANAKDVEKAKAQLIEALRWRKKVQPQRLLASTEFDVQKFGGLGFVTTYPKSAAHQKEIVTWNIYGAVKDNKATFGNVEEFVRWRAALMELSVKELDLPSATENIPENGTDPYRMIQIHDYLNVSFLRMDPTIKAASTETIKTFSMAYPELLKEKFFINIPLVMGWVFSAMKLFLSPETIKKFHPLSYGSSLAGELKDFGQDLPVEYGGKGKDVTEGLTVKYTTTDYVKTIVENTTPPSEAPLSAQPTELPANLPTELPAETVERPVELE